MAKEQVFADVKAHIAQCGGSYSSWYAGIAADPGTGFSTGIPSARKAIPGFTASVPLIRMRGPLKTLSCAWVRKVDLAEAITPPSPFMPTRSARTPWSECAA
jgi:hypothetical protein